ncbi:hypothetical protein, partial [Vibrio parahaemolyticus]|uniref:hypothetical protein n=1 Tax=Vibrio parahaemolyticus TaxID=670 RepID=UPI001ED94EDB
MNTLQRVKNSQIQKEKNRSDTIKKESKELRLIEKSSISSIQKLESTAKKNIEMLALKHSKWKRNWTIFACS